MAQQKSCAISMISYERRGGPKMKKGEIVEGIIERAEFPNKGILETKEGKVVVKNTIPGQKVRAVIQKERQREEFLSCWKNPNWK